jgi:hypothetical protein
MSTFVVVVVQPAVRTGLQRVDAVTERLAKRDLIKLLQYRLVEPFADSVVCDDFTLVFACSVPLIARKSWQSCLSARPQYSVPRSVRIRKTGRSCSS